MPTLLDTLLSKKTLAALAVAAGAGLAFGFVEGLIIASFAWAALLIVGNLRDAKRGFDRFDENLRTVCPAGGAAAKTAKIPDHPDFEDLRAQAQSEFEAWDRQQWDCYDKDPFRPGDEAFSPEYSHLVGNSWHRWRREN